MIGLSVLLLLIVAGIVCGGFDTYQESKNVNDTQNTQRTPRVAFSKNTMADRAAETFRANF